MSSPILKKINVIGTSGSGKSTFSKDLAGILSMEYIEMDALFWGKNWYWPSDEEFFPIIENALKKDRWVLDGNYTRTIHLKWENVDTIIWLDFSFFRTMLQAIKRAVVRSYTKKEIWPGTGNRESFRVTFLSRDSILVWTLKTYKKNRKKYNAIMTNNKYAHINFIRLTSPKECSAFLSDLKYMKSLIQ